MSRTSRPASARAPAHATPAMPAPTTTAGAPPPAVTGRPRPRRRAPRPPRDRCRAGTWRSARPRRPRRSGRRPRARAFSARRKPRLGACCQGTGPCPFHPLGAARPARGGSRCARTRTPRGRGRRRAPPRPGPPRRRCSWGRRARPRRRVSPAVERGGPGLVGEQGGRRSAQQVAVAVARGLGHPPILPGRARSCLRAAPHPPKRALPRRCGAGEARVRPGRQRPGAQSPRYLILVPAERRSSQARDDAGGHAGLGGLAPGARVVHLLVADLAVDLQHAVVVAEHVVGDRAGEGVLGVGVDVHLDDAVVEGLADLLEQRAGAAVEDQVERLVLAVLRADRVLDVLEDRRA